MFSSSAAVPAPVSVSARVWAELDPMALLHNVALLRSRLPGGETCRRIIAVIKANAYGHGAAETAQWLQRFGVEDFAVATCEEGAALRKSGVNGSLLILCPTPPEEAFLLARYRLIQSLPSLEYAALLDRQGIPLRAELKIDTGMHRLGEDFRAADRLHALAAFPRLKITGAYTHLQKGSDPSLSRRQIVRFRQAVSRLHASGVHPGRLHVQNSAGVWSLPSLPFEAVRVGMALYGVRDRLKERKECGAPALRPVLSLKAPVIQVRRLAAGEGAGYSGVSSPFPRTIAVLAAGFADGVPRHLSHGGAVLLRGQRCPVVEVCMDMMLADVTGLSAAAGDVATLIGTDGGACISAEEIAAVAETVTSDILCRLTRRVERRWLPLP